MRDMTRPSDQPWLDVPALRRLAGNPYVRVALDALHFKPHTIVMATIFAGAVALGFAVLPGENERIAALERDGQMRRALDLLEARFARGDRSQRTLFDLQRFYEYYGESDRSRQVLELLAGQRPRDPGILRQLALLYRAIQDETGYKATLRRQLDLRYSEPVCKELIGLLRRDSDWSGEQALIKECRDNGYRRPDDLVRLAFLEAADGHMQEAARILAAVDDRRWLREAPERQLLFSALIDNGQAPEAARRGTRWMRGLRDPDMTIDLVYKLVDANRNDLAIQLAREVGQPGDEVSLTVGEIMIDQLQHGAARAYLKGWLDQNRSMDLELATRFITAAVDAEDLALALDAARRFGINRLEQRQLGMLGLILASNARWTEFDNIRPSLAAETMSQDPMLAAAVELRQGRTDLARGYLSRVKATSLDERRFQWFSRLTDQAGRSPQLNAVLREASAALQPQDATPAEPVTGPVVESVAPTQPPIVVGPIQAKTKQRILSRADINRKLREKRKQVRPPTPAPGLSAAPPGGKAFNPFNIP